MKTKFTVDLIHGVSHECSMHLPINNSLIPLLILNQTMSHHLSEQELSLKKLYTTLGTSELGARNHITKLAQQNWLIIEKSTEDTRVKLVRPTQKLIDTFEHLSGELDPTTLKVCDDCPHLKSHT